MKKLLLLGLSAATLLSCSVGSEKKSPEEDSSFTMEELGIVKVRELSDEEYPDNPDISIRHSLDGTFDHLSVEILRLSTKSFQLIFYPNNASTDTLILKEIDLLEWIPTIPDHIKEDEYLSLVGIVNQEWNRQQVKIFDDHYNFKGNAKESKLIKRVDLARNCLNAYLWEVIAYAEEQGSLKPIYHGWFDFPKEMYAQLFEERNGVPFSKYEEYLVDWKDPVSEKINLDLLRIVESEKEITFDNLNDQLYPLVGERAKKNRNIIYPKEATSIQDFLNDSTRFGMFTPPGFYNTKDPRVTYLSLLSNLEKVNAAKVISKVRDEDVLAEWRLTFDNGAGEKTDLIVGGIDTTNIPVLNPDEVHKGYQMPMGIANHSFYETYEVNQSLSALKNPFYAFLLDAEGKWIDSHKIGIDGPLFHYDEEGRLHLWILSFERHAFVGHYILN